MTIASALRPISRRPVPSVLAPLALVGGWLLVAAPALAQRAALTQNVDEPGRTPFALQSYNATLNPYFATFTVPANQRYVIEKFSVGCNVVASTYMTEISISATTGGKQMEASATAHLSQFNGFLGGSQVNYYRATGDGPLYADPGTTINVFTTTAAGAGYTYLRECLFSITGHAISNP